MAATKDSTFYTALRAEIEKNTPATPIDYSYSRRPEVGADNWIAAALNFVPDGVKALDPQPNQPSQVLTVINVTDGAISQLEFATSLRLSEMTSLTAPQQTYLQILGSLNNGFNYSGRIQNQLQNIFPATGTGTVQAQLALKATRLGSRAEFLFGVGTTIDISDVTIAHGSGW